MNINDATIYCISAKNSLLKLDDNSRTLQGIREEAKQWAIYCSHYSFDDVRDLVTHCARNNVKDARWNDSDINGVAWYVGVYSMVAVKSGLVQDFETIFKSAFIKYFNS